MSEYEIPFHIQEEIMKRLPVKSLIQFRSVSKAWRSLIDSSQFIAAHTLHRHTQPQNLLVAYDMSSGKKYFCYIDDDTLLQQRPIPTSPPSEELIFSQIVGISHGLVCFFCPDTKLAVIWNLSIRKSISIAVPCETLRVTVGFGVCPVTNDPKIVAVPQYWGKKNIESSYSCKVMVYTLSSGEWRSLSTNLRTKPLQDSYPAVSVDGFIYWLCEVSGHNMIISFDVTNENFGVIDLPDSLARLDSIIDLDFYKVKGSLGIIQSHRYTDNYTIWMMEDGVQRLFTKLFTIYELKVSIKGFRESGIPIVGRIDVLDDFCSKLVVYEPNSEHDIVFGNTRYYFPFESVDVGFIHGDATFARSIQLY